MNEVEKGIDWAGRCLSLLKWRKCPTSCKKSPVNCETLLKEFPDARRILNTRNEREENVRSERHEQERR